MITVDTPVRRRAPLALLGICILAAALYAWGIGDGSIGNGFYSAAVRSMSQGGWRDLLFGAYDRAGVVTVDKPPLAFWPQVLSTAIFGFSGWALLLPQVLEGVAAVVVLHRTVRRWAGEGAGLLAALVLACTPITVAIVRDTNPDPLLVLLLVIAAYLLSRAVANPRWLLLVGVALGLAFVTKMLQAWVVVPAFALAWLVGSAAPWGRRIGALVAAGVAMLVAGLWWVVLVDAWPAPKPFVGGSADGSAWNLVVGYNGLGRILGSPGAPGGLTGNAAFGMFSTALAGAPGAGRLFDAQNAGQISWLLPLCALVLVVVAVRWRGLDRTARAVWALWGGWLLLSWAVFSLASGTFHPYYTAMAAPAVAAVVGAGVPLLRAAPRWVLPLGVLGTAAWAAVIVARDPSWFGWTGWAALALGAVAAVLLCGRRPGEAGGPAAGTRVTRAATVVGAAALLLTPLVWSAATAVLPSNAFLGPANPTAGPAVAAPFIGALHLEGKVTPAQMAAGLRKAGVLGADVYGAGLGPDQRATLRTAEAGSAGRAITLAVEGGAITASSYLLAAGPSDVIVGMGGFTSDDPAPTAAELAGWVAQGRVRYVLSVLPGRPGDLTSALGGTGSGDGALAQRVAWVRAHCTDVTAPGHEPAGLFGREALYDCDVR